MNFRKIYREANENEEDIPSLELQRKINNNLPTILTVMDEQAEQQLSLDDVINYCKTRGNRPDDWGKLAEKVFDDLGFSRTLKDDKSLICSHTAGDYAVKIVFAYIDDIYYKHIKDIKTLIKFLSDLLAEFPDWMSIEEIYDFINRNKGNFEYSETEDDEEYEDYEEAPEITQQFIFQKVYENDDMIEPETDFLETEIDDDEALNIATCYLQDDAWGYFEGQEFDNYEEWEEEFKDWFLSHNNVEIEDDMVDQYEGMNPADRF